MGFADWKKRSKQFTDLYWRVGQTHLGAIETACQAAYKAGEREGRKQVEAVAKNCGGLAVLAERERCANVVEAFPHWLGENGKREIVDAIRMRSNA